MGDTREIDVNTDNLDEFTELLHGTAKEKTPDPELEKEEPVTEETQEAVTEDVENLAPEDDAEDGTDEETAEEETEAKPPKKKKSFQERINEVLAARREAEEREAKAKAESADLLRRLEALEGKSGKPAEATDMDGLPKSDDLDENGEPKYPLGEFDPKYVRDTIKVSLEKEREQLRAEERQRVEKTEIERAEIELQVNWEAKLEEAEVLQPDIRTKALVLDTVTEGVDPEYTKYLANTIMSLENGPEVLLYLADNIDEARRIVAGGPTSATIALGRIDGRIPKSAEKPKVVTKAPEPPAARNRGTSGKFDVADDTDDLIAFEKKFYS